MVKRERGRPPKDGDRFDCGKLRPAVQKPVTLVGYQLDRAREYLRADLTDDPIWQTRAAWLNLNQRIGNELVETALDTELLYKLHGRQIAVLMSRKPNHNTRISVEGSEEYDARWLEFDKKDIEWRMKTIKAALTERERRAVKGLCVEYCHPDDWASLESGLTKLRRIFGQAPPRVKEIILKERRSEVAWPRLSVYLSTRPEQARVTPRALANAYSNPTKE